MPYDDWHKNLKEKRDPIAHRIPLYIPHSVHSSEEREKYNKINVDLSKPEEALENIKKKEQLGSFKPYFVWKDDNDVTPIYPTVPEDVANLVEICNIVMDSI